MLSSLKSLFSSAKTPPEQQLVDRVKSSQVKQVVVYGAGELGKRLLPLLRAECSDVRIVAIVDRRAKYSDFKLAGLDVLSADKLKDLSCDAVVVASVAFLDEITPYIAQNTDSKTTQIITV